MNESAMRDVERQQLFYASLPRKRMGAGLVCRDAQARVLLVRPTYKPTWEIPGGAVETDESPAAAVVREALEELGVELPVGRLLTVDWIPPRHPKTEGVMLLFDGGILDEATAATFQLPADELSEWAFVEPDRFEGMLTPTLTRRLLAALAALDSDATSYLEDGEPVADDPYAGDKDLATDELADIDRR